MKIIYDLTVPKYWYRLASREYEGVNEATIIKELGKLTTVTSG